MGSNLRNYVIEIRTEIEINATVDEVWRVLTDLEHYEDWNPFIVNASGIIQPGGSIDFETNVPGRDPMKVRDAPITLFDDHREFRWGGSFEHETLFFGEQSFKLIPIGADKTRLVHKEVFKGMLTRFLDLKDPFTEAFRQMDSALKRTIEEQ